MGNRFKPKFHIKKGDTVEVIAGDDKSTKERGTVTGRVIEVDYTNSRVLVEGINIVSKHTRPTQQYPNGGIIKKEAPIHISNVQLVDPKTGKGIRVNRKAVDGKIVRTNKSGEIIK
ncbi:MAG TPA: 50S ribosomal protein L24 [Chitinophagales bacterium]|nr:50S ribosomal protein L24 [Chitinophagales bacterium]